MNFGFFRRSAGAIGLTVVLAAASLSAALAQDAATPAGKAKPAPAASVKITEAKTPAAKKPVGKTPAAKTAADAKGKVAKTGADAGKKTSPAAEKPGPTSSPVGKATQLQVFGEWTAYAAGSGKGKTCYSLAKPKDRQPATLKRDPGYVFISNRPAETVTNEVAFVMGFDVKADSTPTAEIGATSFDLVAKGADLWVKNAAEESKFVEALRKGQRLVVKAESKKGNMSTDIYQLAGVGSALERARKECE